MQIGSLVRAIEEYASFVPGPGWAVRDEMPGPVGIIIDWCEEGPVVFWNEDFSAEIEYVSQLQEVGCST